jgi:predicted anti-sigma-YlaC factor YlaD
MLPSATLHSAPTAACIAVQQLWFAQLDGEGNANDLSVAAEHVEHCAMCRQTLAADQLFHHAVRRAAQLDVAPATLRERIAHTVLQRGTAHTPA